MKDVCLQVAEPHTKKIEFSLVIDEKVEGQGHQNLYVTGRQNLMSPYVADRLVCGISFHIYLYVYRYIWRQRERAKMRERERRLLVLISNTLAYSENIREDKKRKYNSINKALKKSFKTSKGQRSVPQCIAEEGPA